eukprot:7286509-Karenia_brevis.AAC.1
MSERMMEDYVNRQRVVDAERRTSGESGTQQESKEKKNARVEREETEKPEEAQEDTGEMDVDPEKWRAFRARIEARKRKSEEEGQASS